MPPMSARRVLSVGEKAAVVVAAVSISLGLPLAGEAQLKGHYVPGFTGLQNGSQGPPAITVIMPIFFYTTDTLKGDDGNTLGAHPRINSSFLGPGLVWVTNVKFLGGNLGGQALPVAFMKARIEGASLDVPGSFNFSDMYFQPLQLGWEKPRADFVAGWGIFFPTGKWEQGGDENGGLGMWSNDFQFGTTVRLDDKRAWTASLLTTYEIHSKKKDTDIKVGNILTLEGGVGKSFYKTVEGTPVPRILTFGLVYYAQFKVTSDSGPLGTPLLEGKKDHVYGVGLEGSVFLPKPKLLLGLRFVPELGAINRTEGYTFMLTLAYQAKSLMKMPHQ
jgi:hypothetical protein